MKNITKLLSFLLLTVFLFGCSNDDDTSTAALTITDADGNVYNTIKIGNQIWTLENLKTRTYNDGTPITEYTFATFGNDWGNLTGQEGLYQWADTSDLNNVVVEPLAFDAYGAMYNHFAIQSGKLAPAGWRIPTEADYMELERFLTSEGHTGSEATVLKTESEWLPSSGNGTNLYGFNALPNGYVNALGGPTLGQGTCTWITSDVSTGSIGSQTRKMISLFNNGSFNYDVNPIQIGAGIRLIKE